MKKRALLEKIDGEMRVYRLIDGIAKPRVSIWEDMIPKTDRIMIRKGEQQRIDDFDELQWKFRYWFVVYEEAEAPYFWMHKIGLECTKKPTYKNILKNLGYKLIKPL